MNIKFVEVVLYKFLGSVLPVPTLLIELRNDGNNIKDTITGEVGNIGDFIMVKKEFNKVTHVGIIRGVIAEKLASIHNLPISKNTIIKRGITVKLNITDNFKQIVDKIGTQMTDL